MEVLRVALLMVLSIVLTVAVQVVERARLSPEQRGRGWNGASWGAAVYAFGPGSMLGFFWVTRRPGARGVAIAITSGLGWAVALFHVLQLIDLAFEEVTSWR